LINIRLFGIRSHTQQLRETVNQLQHFRSKQIKDFGQCLDTRVSEGARYITLN